MEATAEPGAGIEASDADLTGCRQCNVYEGEKGGACPAEAPGYMLSPLSWLRNNSNFFVLHPCQRCCEKTEKQIILSTYKERLELVMGFNFIKTIF